MELKDLRRIVSKEIIIKNKINEQENTIIKKNEIWRFSKKLVFE